MVLKIKYKWNREVSSEVKLVESKVRQGQVAGGCPNSLWPSENLACWLALRLVLGSWQKSD